MNSLQEKGGAICELPLSKVGVFRPVHQVEKGTGRKETTEGLFFPAFFGNAEMLSAGPMTLPYLGGSAFSGAVALVSITRFGAAGKYGLSAFWAYIRKYPIYYQTKFARAN